MVEGIFLSETTQASNGQDLKHPSSDCWIISFFCLVQDFTKTFADDREVGISRNFVFQVILWQCHDTCYIKLGR